MLLPKSMTGDARGVQQGPARRAPARRPDRSSSPTSTARRSESRLTRNPKWWGTPPLLDIDHLPGARRRGPDPRPAEQRASTPPASRRLRRADDRPRHTAASRSGARPAPSWYHFTFNGAPGSILADKALRTGGRQGHRPAGDRQRHPARPGRQSGPAEQPHLRRGPGGLPGQQRRGRLRPRGGQAGARRAGLAAERSVPREGRPPAGRSATCFYDAQSTRQIGQIAQNNLAQIGVKLELDAKARRRLLQPTTSRRATSTSRSSPGSATHSRCLASPRSTPRTGESNFGKIGSPEIDAKIEQTLAELDPAKARALANEVDKLIWAGGLQPAAVPVAGQRRGAQHSRELRRRPASATWTTPRSAS